MQTQWRKTGESGNVRLNEDQVPGNVMKPMGHDDRAVICGPLPTAAPLGVGNFRAPHLSSLGYTLLSNRGFDRRKEYLLEPNAACDDGSRAPEQVSDFYGMPIPDNVAHAAMQQGKIGHVVNVINMKEGGVRCHDVDALTFARDYVFDRARIVKAVIPEVQETYRVPPRIDECKQFMYSKAFSVETTARSLNIKMPKMVAAGTPNVEGRDRTYGEFEQLRSAVHEASANDDYALRFAQLANVVLHAYTLAELSRVTIEEGTVLPSEHHMLEAETPMLQPATFAKNHFVNIGTDLDPRYRAFFLIGLSGVHQLSTKTVYNDYTMVTELGLDDDIIFVRRAGVEPASSARDAPPAASWHHVRELLAQPERCLAYYNAYAAMLGLQDRASTILRQMAHVPFMFSKRAQLPYKACWSPKADAYRYLLHTVADEDGTTHYDVRVIIRQAPIIVSHIKVGFAASHLQFKAQKALDVKSVVAGLVSAFKNTATTQHALRSLLQAYGGCSIGLEWVDPFREDSAVALQSCLSEYRQNGWMLSNFRNIGVFQKFYSLFKDGVDMSQAIVDLQGLDTPYRPILAALTFAGRDWVLEPEMTKTMRDALQKSLKEMSSWHAAVRMVAYKVLGSVEPKASLRYNPPLVPPTPNVIEPTPSTPSAPSMPGPTKTQRSRTLSGGLRELTLKPETVVSTQMTAKEGTAGAPTVTFDTMGIPAPKAPKHERILNATRSVVSTVRNVGHVRGKKSDASKVSVESSAVKSMSETDQSQKPLVFRAETAVSTQVDDKEKANVEEPIKAVDTQAVKSWAQTVSATVAKDDEDLAIAPSELGPVESAAALRPQQSAVRSRGNSVSSVASSHGAKKSINTVVERGVSPAPSLTATIKSALTGVAARPVASQSTVSDRLGPEHEGLSMAVGQLQQAEIQAVENTTTPSAALALASTLTTADGKLALVDKWGKDLDMTAIMETVNPGALGSVREAKWVISDVERRNVTTIRK